MASFLTIVSLFRLKRTEIDLALRKERRKILEELDQYIFNLISDSLEGHFRKKIREGAYETLCLSEISRFRISCELAFQKEDMSKIQTVVIDQLNQSINDAFSLIRLEDSESALTFSFKERKEKDMVIVEQDKEKRVELIKIFNENRNKELGKVMEDSNLLSKMYPVIDEMKNKYCSIEQLYPRVLPFCFKLWR